MDGAKGVADFASLALPGFLSFCCFGLSLPLFFGFTFCFFPPSLGVLLSGFLDLSSAASFFFPPPALFFDLSLLSFFAEVFFPDFFPLDAFSCLGAPLAADCVPAG